MEVWGVMALELADFAMGVGYLILIFAGAALGGFLANMFYGFYGYSGLHNRLLSLENSIRGNKGVAVRAAKEERLSAAVAEGAAMMKQGQKPLDVVKALAPKYPDVAMDFLKKLSKGEIPGVGDLLGEEE